MVKSKVVAAAGCVLFTRSENVLKVLLIHRPRYDDWSFPKGKRDPGESDLECALRELKEETGAKGEVINELTPMEYSLNNGKTKSVRFWSVEYVGGKFKSNDEVDEVVWLTVAEAEEKLSYDRDRKLLAEFFATTN